MNTGLDLFKLLILESVAVRILESEDDEDYSDVSNKMAALKGLKGMGKPSDRDSISQAEGDPNEFEKIKAAKMANKGTSDAKKLRIQRAKAVLNIRKNRAKDSISNDRKVKRFRKEDFRKDAMGDANAGKFDRKGNPAKKKYDFQDRKLRKIDPTPPMPLNIKGKPGLGKKMSSADVRGKSINTSRLGRFRGEKRLAAKSDLYQKSFGKYLGKVADNKKDN